MTDAAAEVTVEGVALCIMGTFRREPWEREAGRRSGMVTMAACGGEGEADHSDRSCDITMMI